MNCTLTVPVNCSSSVNKTSEGLVWSRSHEMKCGTVTLDSNGLGHAHFAYLYHNIANISIKCDWKPIDATAKWSDLEHMTSRGQIGKSNRTGACTSMRCVCVCVYSTYTFMH